MIDKDFAKKQLNRLSGLDGFPREKEATHELLLAIQSAETQEMAAQVIDGYVRSIETAPCPKPSDIRRSIWDRIDRQSSQLSSRRHCQQCYGSGFKRVQVAKSVPGIGRQLYDFSVPCDHVAGS